MSEEQLFVFGNNFLFGKEMIYVQITIPMKFLDLPLYTIRYDNNRNLKIKIILSGKYSILELCPTIIMIYQFNIEKPFSQSIHPPKMTVRDIQ